MGAVFCCLANENFIKTVVGFRGVAGGYARLTAREVEGAALQWLTVFGISLSVPAAMMNVQ
jgi:hypothetical protein